jgi:hypothetical protein
LSVDGAANKKCKHFGPSEMHCSETLNYKRFSCTKFHLLKNWTTTLPGTIDLQFDISKENDRRRLEKVIELMEID